MIHLVDQMLEAFLRDAVPLAEGSVDVSFATPDRAWGAGITRPTVNLFLWDIKRSSGRAAGGVAETDRDGSIRRRPVAPTIDLRYYVSAWTSEGRDEHQLLGALLRTVVTTPTMPPEHLPSGMATGAGVTLELAANEAGRSSDFWSSLDGQLKPGLDLRLGIDLEAFPWEAAAAPAAVIDVGLARIAEQPGPARRMRSGPVRAPSDRTRVRRGGRLIEEPGRSTPERPAGAAHDEG